MLHLSCERVFDDSCSHVPVMSCIFFEKKMTCMQKCPRHVKCLTRMRHRYNSPNEVSMLPRVLQNSLVNPSIIKYKEILLVG